MKDKSIIEAGEIIRTYARLPNVFICDLFRDNNFVALGENHASTSLHDLVAGLVEPLKKNAGLNAICLEIHSDLQQLIGRYLASGNEEHLNLLIEEHKRLVEAGYPFEGRLKSHYFDIVRNAYKHNIRINAIQPNVENIHESDLDLTEIDRQMANMIPTNGLNFIYAGELHLRKDYAIPFFRPEVFVLSAHQNPIYRTNANFSCIDRWLYEILKGLPDFPSCFGIELRNSKFGDWVDKEMGKLHLTPYSSWFDGLLVY